MTTPMLAPLGMDVADYEAVTAKRHAGAAWHRFSDYRFASGRTAVPIAASELSATAVELPLLIEREGNNYRLMSLLSINGVDNRLITKEGRWRVAYIPAVLRGYPFSALKTNGEVRLAIERAAVQATAAAGSEPFFIEEEPTELVRQIAKFIEQLHEGVQALSIHLKELADRQLLVPMEAPELSVTLDNELLTVSEEALQALKHEDLSALSQSGALKVAHAQSLSLQKLHFLRRLERTTTSAIPSMEVSADPASTAASRSDDFLSAVRQDYQRGAW